MKHAVLFRAGPALIRLAGRSVPITVALKVRRVLRLVMPELEALDAARQELLTRHAIQRDGAPAMMQGANGEMHYRLADPAAFGREWAALLEDEVVLELPSIPLTLFGEMEIAAADLDALLDAGCVSGDGGDA